MAKILILDIETAPNVAYVWGFFKEFIQPKQVLEDCTILSWSAKWLGEKKFFYEDTSKQTESEALAKLVPLLDKANMVVGHNVSGFDMPKIRGRCLVNGINLPSPYKEIDTYKAARRAFGFDKNSLEYLANILGVEAKGDHKKFPGFELWLECLRDNKEAWAEMKKYNMLDVSVTEQVYLNIRPYIDNHPNVGVYNEPEEISCPKCGADSSFQERRGFSYTNTGKYQQYACKSCGGWHRTRNTEYPKDIRKHLTVNSVG
jgi:hypothetical protein